MTAGPLDVEMGALAAGDPVLQAFAYVFASTYGAARAAAGDKDRAIEISLCEAECATWRFRHMLREADKLAKAEEAGQ